MYSNPARCRFVKFTGRDDWLQSRVWCHVGLPVRGSSPHRQAGDPLQCIQMGIVPAGVFHERTSCHHVHMAALQINCNSTMGQEILLAGN